MARPRARVIGDPFHSSILGVLDQPPRLGIDEAVSDGKPKDIYAAGGIEEIHELSFKAVSSFGVKTAAVH